MLRLTSKKTLPILLYILDNTSFTQTRIRDDLDISIGRINRIVKFLVDKGIVLKLKGRYELVQPNRLCELIANTYEMIEHQTFFLDISKRQLLDLVKRSDATLCLESALDMHVRGFKAEAYEVYHNDELLKHLNKVERGNSKLVVYKKPHQVQTGNSTGKQLTVIELLASGRVEQAKILSERIWHTKQ